MKLGMKVLIILASIWITLSMAIFFYSKYSLVNEYKTLERHEIVDQLEQANKTLKALMSSIKMLNSDWSQWDDAYKFMQDKNPAFINSNLEFTTFENAKINLILFYDRQGKLFYGMHYDLEKKKFIPISSTLATQIESEKAYTMVQDSQGKLGILKTDMGYAVLSAQPIMTSQGTGPVKGTLVMGYFFNDNQIKKLADIINMSVHFIPLPLDHPEPELANAYAAITSGMSYVITPVNENLIFGYMAIMGIDNSPVGIIRISAPRDLYQQGLDTIHHYLFIIITMGILSLFATWLLLRVLVLNRISDTSKAVFDINANNNFSKRIKTDGNDELTVMISAFNGMLEVIELTQEQLKYRIIQRTEELERLSKLNKNLFNEMSKQKETESQLLEQQKSLRLMAYYDPMTNLPNRFFFQEILEKMINRSSRDGSNFAVVFLDADKFKNINDTYGHDIGDKFIQHIAHQLSRSIKDSDVAARFGGDEFFLYLGNIRGKQLINNVITKIMTAITTPLLIDGFEVTSTFSVGISTYPDDGMTTDDLEKHADLAMYYAKRQLGNTFYYYSDIKQETVEPTEPA